MIEKGTGNEMNENTTVDAQIAEMIETEPIRHVVELHPEVMPILAGHGLDLCCGGGHTIAEAARLHELDAELLSEQIKAVVAVRARG
jgi:iron-sulfur cluster repair protein YtfE (RIC family)